MGYEVKQNVGILGHQFDIILTYTQPGGINTKTAIECKYVENGNLQKNDVMENINALVDIKRNDEVDNLIIVTTNGFAKGIWATAKKNNIQLLTYRELKHHIIKFDIYLAQIIEDYEKDELYEYFVDLCVQDSERNPINTSPVEEYINRWMKNNDINHISILGEYGTGKTSICRKIAHDFALKYLKEPLNNRIPIIINLRDYSEVVSVRQLITDLLINEYGLRGIDYPLFSKMNEDGMFLLIFDGFDEMAQKVIFDVAYSNFSKIAELAKPKNSKIIMTCRTEFFRTYEKEREILLDIDNRSNFNIVYLKEFNESQIKTFLKKRLKTYEMIKRTKFDWQYYYKTINEIYDLRDLAKRPVLLELITKHLSKLIKEENINASTLYRITIQDEIKRRLTIGKTVIQRDDRIKLMKLLAIWMYNSEKLSVEHELIPELLDLKNHFNLKTRTDIEYHLNDFLTCSFLNRDQIGNYHFSHKSFLDFLVAWKLVDDIEENNYNHFSDKLITYEVVKFMKNFDVKISQLYRWIKSTKKKTFSDTKYLGGNAISLLYALGEDFEAKRFDFSDTILDYANLGYVNFKGLNFRH